MRQWKNKAKRARRGMAMVTTMLVMFGILTIGLLGVFGGGGAGRNGAMYSTGNAIQMAGARTQSTNAFNMAESGVEYTLQWLNSLPQPPTQTTAFTPAFTWAQTTATGLRTAVTPNAAYPGQTFQVVIYPDVNNKPTGQVTGNPAKSYLIESVGRSGGETVILQAYVRTSSLSKWLVLVNNWTSGNYWVSGLSTFDGPVHDNNFSGDGSGLPNGLLENVAWYDANGCKANGWTDSNGNPIAHPLFTYTGNDAYESSGPYPPDPTKPGVNWYRDNNFGGTSPPTGTDWQYVAAGGQNTVSSDAPTVPFPQTSSAQECAALGLPPNSATPTLPHGVTVNANGGVTIGGDVDQMTMSVDPSNSTTQVVEVYQTDPTTGQEDYTKISIDAQGHTTEETGTAPAGSLTAASVTLNPASTWPAAVTTVNNGVIYCDGNIGAQGDPKSGGLSGTVADNAVDGNGNVTHSAALTIATDATKNCNIDGSIIYNTARAKNPDGSYVTEDKDPNFTKHAGTLGVVTDNILITETTAGGSTIGDIETDGTFLAHGVFDVDHYASRAPHNWENMGGYLSSTVGVFGVFNNSTGKIVSGMNNQFNYDARMRDNPPPFFPTNGNIYDVLSWRRVPVTLDGAVTS